MDGFQFDPLSPTEFEEFCYDLLVAQGANKINWRKGTGLSASPADGGRDIECEFLIPEVGGGHRVERWFVECKHQKSGVSPNKISAALSWASAYKPDCLLLVASGYFSNPCKDFLEKHSQNNPGFRIQIWERKDCERLAVATPQLLRKFKLFEIPKIFDKIHPAHAYFLRWPQYHTLDDLFGTLECAGPERFHNTLSLAYFAVINPTLVESTDDEQTIGELLSKPVTYSEFRRKCLELSQLVAEGFLVQAIIHSALTTSFHLADETDIARQDENWSSWTEAYKAAVQAGTHTENDLERFLRRAENFKDSRSSEIERSKIEYQEFCEAVLAPLLLIHRDVLDFISSVPNPPAQNDSDSDDDIPFRGDQCNLNLAVRNE